MAKDIFGCLSPGEEDELRKIRRELKLSDDTYEGMKQKCVSKGLHRGILAARRRTTKRRIAWTCYAALIAMLLSVGAYFLFRPADTVQPVTEMPADRTLTLKRPERKQPELILANGEVVKLRREAQEEQVAPRIVNTGETLEYERRKTGTSHDTVRKNTIYVPFGGEYNIRLSDGTRIWVNEGTRVEYPETFVSGTREIFLIIGEIYLEVARDTKHPFIVKTPNGEVEVLGTHFNVRCRDRMTVETTLVEGSVKVSALGRDTILQPGQQAYVSRCMLVGNVDVEEYICWKDNLFFFKNVPLEEILGKLARWYGFELFWRNPELKNTLYYVYIDKYASVGEILEKLSEAGNIRLTVSDRTVFVSK